MKNFLMYKIHEQTQFDMIKVIIDGQNLDIKFPELDRCA